MDAKTVERVARLARIRLDPAANEELLTQLSAILEHFESLAAVETGAVEPAVHGLALEARLRDDEPREGPGREQLLSNTEHHRDGMYEVPRVIE